jgi:hypothetical protein
MTRSAIIASTALLLSTQSLAEPPQPPREDRATLNAELLRVCNMDQTQANVEVRFDGSIMIELSPTISPEQKDCAEKMFAASKWTIDFR